MRKSWDRERSADLQFAMKPYWMMTSSTPTLARMLAIPAPSASEGKPLPLRSPGG